MKVRTTKGEMVEKINAGDLTSKLASNKSIRSMMCNKHWTRGGKNQNKKQGNLMHLGFICTGYNNYCFIT